MTSHCKNYKCSACDYISEKKYNVTRHIVRTHNNNTITKNSQKGTENSQKGTENSQKGTENSQKGTDFENEEIPHDSLCTSCYKCHKNISNKYNLKRHELTCKGVDTLQCEFCFKYFKYRHNKYEHVKICKIKNEIEQKSLILINSEALKINNENNQNITNNIINSNNTTNNTVINNNIIVYDPANMQLLNDHITRDQFKKIIYNHDYPKILTDFSTLLLGRRENQCVRKTNLHSSSSAVHVGNDKWVYQTDKLIYPKLLSNIATNFGNVGESLKVSICKRLEGFTEDVTCEATDCHDNNQEELALKRQYRILFNNFKHLVFNLTKQELEELKELTI